MVIQSANNGIPVATLRPSSLGRPGIDSAAGKRAFSADATAAIAPIMSEAVLVCLRLFDPATTRK
jgi:hypothetical protein